MSRFQTRKAYTVPGCGLKSWVTGLSYAEQREFESADPGERQGLIRKAVLAHWLDADGKPLVTEEILDAPDGPTSGQYFGAFAAIMEASMEGAADLAARFRNGDGQARGDAAVSPGGEVREAAE